MLRISQDFKSNIYKPNYQTTPLIKNEDVKSERSLNSSENKLSDTQKGLIGLGITAIIITACLSLKNPNKAKNVIKDSEDVLSKKSKEAVEKEAEKLKYKVIEFSKSDTPENIVKEASKSNNSVERAYESSRPEITTKKETKKTAESFGTTNLKNVKPYQNKEVVDEILNLKGTTEENVENIKKIFLKEMGINPDILTINVKDLSMGGSSDAQFFVGTFSYITGELSLNKKVVEKLSIPEIAVFIRHELDHLEKGARVCKTLGVDNYKKLFNDIDPNLLFDVNGNPIEFNQKFWNRAVREVDNNGFDASKYIENFAQNIQLPGQMTRYDNYKFKNDYLHNPFEISAHEIQHSLEKSLNLKTKIHTFEYVLPLYTNIEKEFNLLFEKTPALSQYKSELFDYAFTEAVTESNPRLKALYKKASETNNQDEDSLIKFQQLLTNQISKLDGNNGKGADIELEKKVLKNMVGVIKRGFTHNDILGALNTRLQVHLSQLDGNSDLNICKAIKKSLSKAVDNFLKYIEDSKIEDSQSVLQLLLMKVHCENNITKTSMPAIEELNISPEIKSKIFSNQFFENTLKNSDVENLNPNDLLSNFLSYTALA